MNVTRVSTNDGRAMRIEGGDSKTVANMIQKSFGGRVSQNREIIRQQASQVPSDPSFGSGVDEELALPTMNFGDEDKREAESEGLALPVMNFDPPASKVKQNKQKPAEEGLPLPSMF